MYNFKDCLHAIIRLFLKRNNGLGFIISLLHEISRDDVENENLKAVKDEYKLSHDALVSELPLTILQLLQTDYAMTYNPNIADVFRHQVGIDVLDLNEGLMNYWIISLS